MAKAKKADQTVTAFKAFDADLRCQNYQYEIGATFTHGGTVKRCESGFHACENPMDVWRYYPLIQGDGRLTRYGEVTLSGSIDRDESDTKICSGEITIKAEIALPDFIRRAVNAVIEACKGKAESGDYAKLAASGHSAQLAASGHSAQLAASGHYAQLAASGDSAKLAASGDSAKLAASGDSAKLAASGKDSVIASSSHLATAQGAEGTWISLAEYDANGKCVGFATGRIGQDGLKPDTPYRAQGGKLVETSQ